MAGVIGGDQKKDSIPKMSLLIINEKKDDGQAYANKLEDKQFGKIYATDYVNGHKDKLKNKVHAILAMVNKEDTLEDFQQVLHSYKDYQIRFLTVANPELKNSPVLKGGDLNGWVVHQTEQIEEVKEALKKSYSSNIKSIEALFKKYDDDGGGQLDAYELRHVIEELDI